MSGDSGRILFLVQVQVGQRSSVLVCDLSFQMDLSLFAQDVPESFI